MVRVVRTPAVFKEYFSPEQLNGWPSGFKFDAKPKRKRRRAATQDPRQESYKPPKMNLGYKLA